MKSYYNIAGLTVLCDLPLRTDNFTPFVCSEAAADLVVFGSSRKNIPSGGTLLEEFQNDVGHICLYDNGDSYLIEQNFYGEGFTQRMVCKPDFSLCEIIICPEDPYLGQALSSLVRIAFSQRILFRDGLLIHASCVVNDGLAYMFLGKSGTGKSTHSALWLKHIPGTELLNDDCPAIRISQNGIFVFGTPWSGKTPCYRNASAPLRGIVRLSQERENRWQAQSGVSAWTTIYPSCSVLGDDETIHSALVGILNTIVTSVRIGSLGCLPDASAALLCNKQLTNNNQ